MKNRFFVYQLKPGKETRSLRFQSMQNLKQHNLLLDISHYKQVYSGELQERTTLDELYSRFNSEKPKGYLGHSLSVSDLVVFRQNDILKAFYVDSIGFTELHDFVNTSMQKELQQDYLLCKLESMQQETGARAFVFDENSPPIVTLPPEVKDYFSPDEEVELIQILKGEQISDIGLDLEQEAETLDFEPDMEM